MTSYFFQCGGTSESMVCAPVRRDKPRAIARGLSTVQVDELVSQLYYDKKSVDLARDGVSRAKDLGIWGL